MKDIVSATEARIHFGKLMRRATETGQPIYVEKSGKTQIVVLAIDEFERLTANRSAYTSLNTDLDELHARILKERPDGLLPDPIDVIRQMREERSEQLLNLR